MATHTKTSTKKKLVYTQGPDGVFRLKKEPQEKPKKPVEGNYNELVDCSYKVSSESQQEIAPIPEKPPSMTAPYPNAVVSANNQNSVATHASSDKITENVEVENTKPQDGMWVSNFIRSKIMTDFHTASFFYGFFICLALHQSQPLLGQYAVIIFDAAKIGLLWTAVLGGLGWYFGVINTQDTVSLLQLYTQKVNSLKGDSPPLEAPVQIQPQISAQPSQASIATAPIAVPATEISKGTINQSMPELHKPEFRPPVATRRNTLSRITPFYKTNTKDGVTERKVSSASQNSYIKPAIPAPPRPVSKKAISTEGRRSSSDSLDTTKSVPISNATAAPSINKLNEKELPQHPPTIDELPFVNEIKLVSEDELGDFDFSDTKNVKRSNSVLSKKSLLGTRQNYKKFIANVPTQM